MFLTLSTDLKIKALNFLRYTAKTLLIIYFF